ncbi:hypothetical protein PR048_000544 [Dryococelus australis]|uniref:Uncharacterized protein n=1 Tax=Dryococelus australis TaxID=614101 RepID=A0ABQ9IEY4_9NEOP|nr:hypothetical protein PR048_000544 [Dryococelus australis]
MGEKFIKSGFIVRPLGALLSALVPPITNTRAFVHAPVRVHTKVFVFPIRAAGAGLGACSVPRSCVGGRGVDQHGATRLDVIGGGGGGMERDGRGGLGGAKTAGRHGDGRSGEGSSRLATDIPGDAYARQKAKSKYIKRIRLKRASHKQSSDTHKTPCDRMKRRTGFDPQRRHFPGFSRVRIVTDDAAGSRRVFSSGKPCFPALSFRRCSRYNTARQFRTLRVEPLNGADPETADFCRCRRAWTPRLRADIVKQGRIPLGPCYNRHVPCSRTSSLLCPHSRHDIRTQFAATTYLQSCPNKCEDRGQPRTTHEKEIETLLFSQAKDDVERPGWLRTTNLRVPTLHCFSANTSCENGMMRRRRISGLSHLKSMTILLRTGDRGHARTNEDVARDVTRSRGPNSARDVRWERGDPWTGGHGSCSRAHNLCSPPHARGSYSDPSLVMHQCAPFVVLLPAEKSISRVYPVLPALSFRRRSIFILINSQYLAAKSRPNLFTSLLNLC